MTLFEELGGEAVLRPIINTFIDAMVNDVMIGFFFRDVDIARLQQREYEFAARYLGADVEYTGRPLAQAHARHHIMGGQFDRRRRILEQTIQRHGVAPQIEKAWLEHVDALRAQITGQARGECRDETALAIAKSSDD